MKAEWENWLLDENARCRQVEMMLRENEMTVSPAKKLNSIDAQKVLDRKEKEKKAKLDALRKWQEDYCGSCKRDQELLLEGREHLAFG